MPAAIAIPLITAGIGAGASVGSSLINKSSASNAQKAAAQDPLKLAQTDLIKQQTQQSAWGFDQGKQLLPTVKNAIDLPFNQYAGILSGDPSKYNQFLAPYNTSVDKQTSSARTNIMQFAPRGAAAGQIANLATNNAQAKQSGYWNAWQTSLQGAQQGAGQYQALMNSVMSAGNTAAGQALGALGGLDSNATALQLQKNASSAAALGGLGTGIGQILTGLLMGGAKGGSRSSSGSTPGSDPIYDPGRVYEGGDG